MRSQDDDDRHDDNDDDDYTIMVGINQMCFGSSLSDIIHNIHIYGNVYELPMNVANRDT